MAKKKTKSNKKKSRKSRAKTKKLNIATQKKDNEIYVGIDNSNQIRISLLESLKGLITLLKDIEKLKIARERKYKLFELASVKILEIKTIIRRLQRLLPSTKISSLRFKTKEQEIREEEKEETEPILKREEKLEREVSEIERLEHELKKIEMLLEKIR